MRQGPPRPFDRHESGTPRPPRRALGGAAGAAGAAGPELPPRLPPRAPEWRPGLSFYLGGSAAPPLVSTRRPTSAPAHNLDRRQPVIWGPPPLPPPSAPPLRTYSGACFCCASRLQYSRPEFFTCPLCQTVNDLKVVGAPVAPPPDHVVTAAQIQALAIQLGRGQAPSATNGLHPPTSPEEQLLDYVDAFQSIRSIEASFRDSDGHLPTLKSLVLFYDLVTASPRALDTLRTRVEAILRRPGSALRDSDGGWVIVMLECPLLFSKWTPDSTARSWMVSRLIGLISNLYRPIQDAIVGHLVNPDYPPALLQAKVEMNVAFISLRVGGSLSIQGGHATDWGVIAASRVGALFFAANQRAGLPLATFYCTLLDTLGPPALIESFQIWESRVGHFSLCQYPFLLSLGIKILLLTWDGRRQMEEKAQEAVRNTLYGHRPQNPLLIIRVRRSHLVQDSLRQISSCSGELKKSLKIVFEGEEGLDAGGLRKEWFLLLCRQLFDPQFGMFVSDEDSNLCWFNPASIESSDEYYLVGCTVALAIYNSVTLDVPLPLAVFKKLKGEAVGLVDLAVVRPALAKGLQALLDFDGDVAEVFCRTFVGDYEAWGEVQEVPLLPGGADISVTNSNRADFVRRYCDFVLNTSIADQFRSFAHGFAEVTAGNSFSLFRGEELELLVRGSTEPLDIPQLQSVTIYQGFASEHDPTVQLFWTVFSEMTVERQRQLLSFITGTDRIPATGSGALQLKLTCLGDDTGRYPQSHTCFNELSLYRYRDVRTMESRLVRAMEESEGFGLR